MSRFLGLRTVAQPVADQGAFAANLLVDRLQNADAPNDPHHFLDTKLIERKTTRRQR